MFLFPTAFLLLMSRLRVCRVENPATGLVSPSLPPVLRDAISDNCGCHTAVLPEAHVGALAKVNEWFGPFRTELLAAGFVLMAFDPLPRNVCSSEH